MYEQNWIWKLERRFGKYSIRNLMMYIVMGMAAVYIMDMVVAPISRVSMSRLLSFDLNAIRHGQIWRLVSFVLIPPNTNILFILISLYFYWWIGSTLERQWGSFKFNLYYLFGVIGAVISGCITGYATNHYINLSLFLAFALLYPEQEVRVFYIIPVKMKYLALLEAAGLVLMFVQSSLPGRVSLLVSMANVLVFFGNDMIRSFKQAYRRYKFKKNFR